MRVPHTLTKLPDGHFMRTYWGSAAAMRPTATLLLRGPEGDVIVREAVIDTGSPYICFSDDVADELQMPRPVRRTIEARGASGEPIPIGFPDDGTIRLCISDFATEWFVWAPLIGILPTRPPPPGEKQKRTAILGWTGFLQYFNVSFLDHPTPFIELTAKANFAGRRGTGRPGNVWAMP